MIELTSNRDRKVIAAVVVVMMIAAFAGSSMMIEDEDNESDGLLIEFLVLVTAVETGYIIADYFINHTEDDEGEDDSVIRGYEASAVANSILNSVTTYKTSMENNQQIWKLTNEHHVRQAELAASELWLPGTEFSNYDVLTMSGVYANSANMMDNVASQINVLFEMVSTSLDDWNATDTYKDMMEINIGWGSGSMSSTESVGFSVGTATLDVADGHDRVFLTSDSQVWASGSSTIVSQSGDSWDLQQGLNDLSGLDGFKDDVYELGEGVDYCGDMLPVFDAEAAPLYAGAVMECGDTSKVAIYDDGVIVDGRKGGSLTLTILPDGAESRTVDLEPIMEEFSAMMDTVYGTMSSAGSAAATVWGIFDQAGQASAYLTTLMVPTMYDGMELTQAQQTIITVLAMQQLSDYWQESGGELKTTEYTMSDSMSLFVRGDIVDSTGEMLYENVIYTPFFYQDTTLSTGSNQLQRQAILAVWTTDGENLSSWDGITDASKAMLITADSGYRLDIAEMKNSGQMTNRVDLTVSDISIIDPGKLVHDPVSDGTDNDLDKLIMLAMVIIGLLAIMSGWRSGNYVVMAIGLIIIALGLVASESVENVLEKYLDWRILL